MTTATASPLMLDWLLPEFDATLVEHRVIESDPESVYRAMTSVDMAEIPKTHAPVRILFAARGAAERLVNALLGRPTPTGARSTVDETFDLPSDLPVGPAVVALRSHSGERIAIEAPVTIATAPTP